MKRVMLLLVTVSLVILIINFTRAQADTPKPSALPVYYADGSSVPNAHIVIGQISIPAGGGPGSPSRIEEFPVTLASAAAFASADSYKCFVSMPAGATVTNGGFFRFVDGSHFVFRTARFGPAWQQDFFCIGN